jgi:hypothetical protein
MEEEQQQNSTGESNIEELDCAFMEFIFMVRRVGRHGDIVRMSEINQAFKNTRLMPSPTLAMAVGAFIGIVRQFTVPKLNMFEIEKVIRDIESNSIITSNSIESLLFMCL